MKKMFFVFTIAAMTAAMGDVRVFPEGKWTDYRIERTKNNIFLRDAQNRDILTFRAEPLKGAFIKHVVISQAVDSIHIYPKAAFVAGMAKLVFLSQRYEAKPYAGRDCTLMTEFFAPGNDAKVLTYFEGFAKGGRLYFHSREVGVTASPREWAMMTDIPDWLESLHLRYDILKCGDKPLVFRKAKFAPSAELPPVAKRKVHNPELLFHASFDGSAKADFAKGNSEALEEKGLEFVPGRRGKAVRMTAKAKSLLSYAMKDNVVPERGTVSLWIKREWNDRGRTKDGGLIPRAFFANPVPAGVPRIGSGQLWFWMYGPAIRADQGDCKDKYVSWFGLGNFKDWCHVAITWDEYGIRIYNNGVCHDEANPPSSRMRTALRSLDELSFQRVKFDKFFVGSLGGVEQIEGLIDEFKIYSAPLTDTQVKSLYRQDAFIELNATGCYAFAGREGDVSISAVSPSKSNLSNLRYCILDEKGNVVCSFNDKVSPQKTKLKVKLPAGKYEISTTDGAGFYGRVPYFVFSNAKNPSLLEGEKAMEALKAPGRLSNLELIKTVTFDKLPPCDKFKSVKNVSVKELNGIKYLETDEKEGGRIAVGFTLDEVQGLYCFEFDYPDDKKRTADIIIQNAKNPINDYVMQCGYAAGDEYPNTGKILTHRTLYWTMSRDVATVVMTARTGAPAAISAIRVYKVKGNAIPDAGVGSAAKKRSFGVYYEDPAVGFNFSTPKTFGHSFEELETLIDRSTAVMKYTGQDILAYPGVWYCGLIGNVYNPRYHSPDFLSAWYSKFDEEGLTLYPTMNVFSMPVERGLVTVHSMLDGSLHSSEIAILDTGKPNWGKVHDSPPDFNVYHPKVQRQIEKWIDKLIEQGAGHKSFGGISLHLTSHSLLWFGDETSGYNDYTVQAFAKEKGLKIPVDKNDPMRGRAYAGWLRKNAWREWLQWRCDFITKFYARLARKLSAARPDLKLWINSFVPTRVSSPDFMNADYMEMINIHGGLDRKALEKAASNIILCQSLAPADYRWKRVRYPGEKEKAHMRVIDTLPDYYSLIRDASFPWVNQHDRYWETAIGRDKALACDWLKECVWRVTTINPSGYHALRHFVLPLRYSDVLGVSKGGFLIGTYGMEDVLVPFIKQFRSLPAVVFDDVPRRINCADGENEFVKMRAKTVDGKTCFYVVNTDMKPVTVKITMPAKTCELVGGRRVGGRFFKKELAITLAPYEMKTYVAPKGFPQW